MEFYNIYNIKKYNQESRKKESYTIEELLEKLKKKENYHEIIKKDERIKFIMNIDKLKGCKIEEIIKDLIEFLNKRGVEIVKINCDYHKDIFNLNNLPNSIKKLYIYNYTKELNNLPNSIEYLELFNYKLKIKKIPKNLKTIKCGRYYKYIDDFKNFKDYKITYNNIITYKNQHYTALISFQ